MLSSTSRPQQLHDLLSEATEITIVCHNNPDPDCLASALALGRVAAAAGIDERHILYNGDISHQQNRAFVNLLDIDLQPFEAASVQDRPTDSLLAFVDHSTPGENNRVPVGTPVDVVIGHHPAEAIDARFVDHATDVGVRALGRPQSIVPGHRPRGEAERDRHPFFTGASRPAMPALHSRRRVLAVLGAAVVGPGVARGQSRTPSDTATNSSTARPTGTAEPTATDTDQESRPSIGGHHTIGVTPGRTGYAADESAPQAPVARQWCVGDSATNRKSAIAVVDGTVLSATHGGFRAVDDRSGERQWQVGIEGQAPTVRDERVYVDTRTGIYCLGRHSGRELWGRRFDGLTSHPLYRDGDTRGLVFTVTELMDEDGNTERVVLQALDATTGETVYRVPTGTAGIAGSLAGRGSYVYGGTSAGSVVAFDHSARELAWQAHLGGDVEGVAVTADTVFAGSHAGTVAGFDRTTGDERWRTTLPGDDVEVWARPAVTGDTVFVAAIDGHLYALDRETGTERWRFDGGRGLTRPPTVVGTDDQRVVFGSNEGNVFCLDASSGDLSWAHQLQAGVEIPPTVVDGVVYVGDNTARLYALANEESTAGSEEGACRIPSEEETESGYSDADNDGVADSHDYAPRDGSVQNPGDVQHTTGDDDGFWFGAGVGAALSLGGVGLGYAIWGRSASDSTDASEES